MGKDRSLTLADWDELLDLGGVLEGLAAGRFGPDEARERLGASREVYPGLGLDYIRVLEAFEGVVGEVEDAIRKQNAALGVFNSQVEELAGGFSWDSSRLMTEAERGAFEDFRKDVEREAADRAAAARAAEEEAEMLEAELESLQAELESAQGEVESIQDQIDDVMDELDSLGDE